ncbi:MAG: aminopeptidase [Pseudomonadales bacterium]
MLVIGAVLTTIAGCETIGYYRQAIGGQLAVTLARQPVAKVLANPETEASLRDRLQSSQDMLEYLERKVGLPSEGRYRSYVALDRDAVVYNLVATPAFSVSANQWCYPIAGCAPYRGYFSRQRAQRAAERYQGRGFTTYIGAVPAYSTLGWFADPLLSTFVGWNDARLMTLLAHELSHSKVWVASDVAFNEAFATFVGEQTTRNWLSASNPGLLQEHAWRQVQWRRLTGLVLTLKGYLERLYAQPERDADQSQQTDAAYREFRRCYQQHRTLLGDGRFDAYVAGLNNAALAALATYRTSVPAFAALYAQSDEHWDAFFAAAQALAAQSAPERASQLARLREQGLGLVQEQPAQAGDHEHANQVQCQALAHHGVDGHMP